MIYPSISFRRRRLAVILWSSKHQEIWPLSPQFYQNKIWARKSFSVSVLPQYIRATNSNTFDLIFAIYYGNINSLYALASKATGAILYQVSLPQIKSKQIILQTLGHFTYSLFKSCSNIPTYSWRVWSSGLLFSGNNLVNSFLIYISKVN